MKLLFKQRVFSWLDSYDIFDENGDVLYKVESQLSWGHCLHILDAAGNHVATVQERIFTFLPKFELYLGETYWGCVQKEFSFFQPRYALDCNGWQVSGDFFEWEYSVATACGSPVASVSKEVFHWADTYVIDVVDPQDALCALMLVLAIDAEKCSRD